jgi:CRP-like cAMP-binding protein
MATKKDVEAAIARYNKAIGAANRQRARDLARFADQMPQKDIIEASGYSRETVRRLIDQGRALAAPARPEEEH